MSSSVREYLKSQTLQLVRQRVRTQLEEIDAQVRRVVQDRPRVAVGAALVFGYALGRLLARR